jgi:hypothetical protein
VHLRLERRRARLAFRFGAVQGEIGITQHVVSPLVRQERSDADAHGHDDVRPLHSERRAERVQNAIGDLSCICHLVVDQHGELVAAEARDRIRRAEAVAQPRGNLDEKPVTGGVTEPVVDGLEIVEIDEQDRRRRSSAKRALQGVLDAVTEQDPVRQVGERS